MSRHIVIVAGEESGDAHAADLVKALRLSHPQIKITGIGGKHLQNQGVELVSDLARFGVTGFTEVLKYARVIKKAFKAIKTHLEETKPDLLILVDYPGFNLRLAQFARKQSGLKILYYISPQIWAWKAKRIHKIKASVDKMAVILPFEKALYQKAQIPVSFVGHPLMAKIAACALDSGQKQRLNLPVNRALVAVLPGSRQNEIANHMPVLSAMMRLVASANPQVHFVIPIAETLSVKTLNDYFPRHPSITLVKGEAISVIACSDCVLVASGTASLEAALLLKPMAIFYKTSRITYAAAVKLMKVKYLGLCNLLANKMIVPELIQYDFNVHNLIKTVEALLSNVELRTRMQSDLKAMKASLSVAQADSSLPELVHSFLDADPQ